LAGGQVIWWDWILPILLVVEHIGNHFSYDLISSHFVRRGLGLVSPILRDVSVSWFHLNSCILLLDCICAVVCSLL
jgi:hypothetical protein